MHSHCRSTLKVCCCGDFSIDSLSSSLSPCSSLSSLLTILDHGGVTVGDFDEPRPTAAGWDYHPTLIQAPGGDHEIWLITLHPWWIPSHIVSSSNNVFLFIAVVLDFCRFICNIGGGWSYIEFSWLYSMLPWWAWKLLITGRVWNCGCVGNDARSGRC